MPTLLRPCSTLLMAVALLAATGLAVAAPPVSLAGATALVIQPENSFNGYDFTLSAALLRRGFDVTQGQPEDLADAANLQPYDLVATNLKRSFTPERVAGLKAYLAAGGAMYGTQILQSSFPGPAGRRRGGCNGVWEPARGRSGAETVLRGGVLTAPEGETLLGAGAVGRANAPWGS